MTQFALKSVLSFQLQVLFFSIAVRPDIKFIKVSIGVEFAVNNFLAAGVSFLMPLEEIPIETALISAYLLIITSLSCVIFAVIFIIKGFCCKSSSLIILRAYSKFTEEKTNKSLALARM